MLGPPRKMADLQVAMAEQVRRDGCNLREVGTTLKLFRTAESAGATYDALARSGAYDSDDIQMAAVKIRATREANITDGTKTGPGPYRGIGSHSGRG